MQLVVNQRSLVDADGRKFKNATTVKLKKISLIVQKAELEICEIDDCKT